MIWLIPEAYATFFEGLQSDVKNSSPSFFSKKCFKERRIQNSVERLWWSFFRNQLLQDSHPCQVEKE